MAIKRMLIDSSHPEETRVVVATGNRLDEFDFETSTRKQLKGNIYLAKVMRVEPSLQAAFVDYGGNRHGFLPFSEIHPDYYQIPVSDREALFREQEAAEAEEEEEEERRARRRRGRGGAPRSGSGAEAVEGSPESSAQPGYGTEGEFADSPETTDWAGAAAAPSDDATSEELFGGSGEEPPPEAWRSLESSPSPLLSRPPFEVEGSAGDDSGDMEAGAQDDTPAPADDTSFLGGAPPPPYPDDADDREADTSDMSLEPARFDEGEFGGDEPRGDAVAEAGQAQAEEARGGHEPRPGQGESNGNGAPPAGEPGGVEEIGGDEVDDQERRRAHVSRSLLSRRYKIQEVIKKRQIMLVQVVKEERGTKGAALTTYLSLAGRYCVLMPNAIRGGGISRKIVNAEDRRRLKAITSELDLPTRMGVIVRTAGMNRTKAEIKRDFEYLLRQWESIRELTLRSTAPSLIYGEANLIRRSIRDLYAKEIEEILVEGDEGYRIAKDFMRTLIPSHTSKVQPYRDRVPLFVRYQVESQLDSMYSPQVQLRSGGYLVIDQTEALVAIDVNSGRATRERNIEETAYRTNLEAAEEIARQLRLRDLAGLIVIDFIDMDESRNQRAVERRLKESMKSDRARIQIGRISPFGLLELSRQRLRPSLAEASMEVCPSCGGAGLVRSVESAALHVLRAIEEEGLRGRAAEIRIKLPTKVALYIMNNKRAALADIEMRYAFTSSFAEDNTMVLPGHEIERLRAKSDVPPPVESRLHEPITAESTELPPLEDDASFEAEPEAEIEAEPEEIAARPEETQEEADASGGRGRRRRRRRRGGEAGERGERGERSDSIAPRRAVVADAGIAEAAEEFSEREGIDEPLAGDDQGAEASGAPAEAGGEDEAARSARRRRRGRRGGRRRRGRGGQGGEFDAPAQAQPGNGNVEPVEDLAAGADSPPALAEGDGEGETDDGAGRGRRRRRRGRRERGPGRQPFAREGAANGGTAEPDVGAEQQPWSADVGQAQTVGESPAEHSAAAAFPSRDAIIVENVAEPPAAAPAGEARMEQPARAEPGVELSTGGAPPMPARSDEPGAPPPEPEPSGPPRRGWWQRVLTGR